MTREAAARVAGMRARDVLGTQAENDSLVATLCEGRRPGRRQRQQYAIVQRDSESVAACYKASIEEIHRRRTEESGDVLGGRALEQIQWRSGLLDHAVAQQYDAIGHGHGFDLVMRDVNHGLAGRLVQAP